MAVPARVSLVTLGVADVARATAFYEALGWRRSSASVEGTTFFDTAGGLLALYGQRALAEDAGVAHVPREGFRGVSLSINVESADEVDAILQAVQDAGAALLKPATKAEWGGYSGYFADLDGHAWEVAWNPFFPLGEDGRPTLP